MDMFRDILDFFTKAKAAQGREQWNLAVHDVDFDLQHFRQALKIWDAIEADLVVPAVDALGAQIHWDAWRKLEELHGPAFKAARNGTPVGDPGVDAWLASYKAGRLEPYPKSIAPDRLGPGHSDLAALALVGLERVRAVTNVRRNLDSVVRDFTPLNEASDGLSVSVLARLESDLWFGSLIAGLSLAQRLPEPQKMELGEALRQHFSAYPRKRVQARVTLSDLNQILSLPVWRKRHELYAVWIATEIIQALPDHDCTIHHQDGQIVFAFTETNVATVTSARPPVEIVSERKVPLANPVGKGRTCNVQPDYGLWCQVGGIETCGLIIEVKHYKRSARSSFRDVLTDYSRAHPQAQVFLVNHGPVGDVLSDLEPRVADRCHAIGHLTSQAIEKRKALREAIREYVGEPVRPAQALSGAGVAETIVAVDVSGSMRSALMSPEFAALLMDVSYPHCAEVAAAIDTHIVAYMPIATVASELPSLIRSHNDLGRPVEGLLETYRRVIVVTDEDGATNLGHFQRRREEPTRLGLRIVTIEAEPRERQE
jgi:hypothetical protein